MHEAVVPVSEGLGLVLSWDSGTSRASLPISTERRCATHPEKPPQVFLVPSLKGSLPKGFVVGPGSCFLYWSM